MRFSLVTISFFLIVLCTVHAFLVVAQCPTPVPAVFSHVKPGKVIAGYVGNWDKYNRYDIDDLEPIASGLTHILYAFARPDEATATCQLSDLWADLGANFEHRKKVGGNFGKLLALKKKYPHLKVLLSIGGGTYSKEFSQIAQAGKIDKFVASIIGMLDRYEYEYEHTQHGEQRTHWFEYSGLFDGIDIDWEWPVSSAVYDDVAAYHSLIKKMSKALKQYHRPMLLTSAVQVDMKIINALRLAELTPYVDWYHVMSYNYGGPNSSGISMNAPICNQWSEYSIDGSISALMNQGVSPAKMVLGIPLYGHVYEGTVPKLGSKFEKTGRTGTYRYDQIKDLYLSNPDCTIKFHNVSQVPYAYCPEGGVFVSYDDEVSVAHKAAYAKKKRLLGVFFWRLSGDEEYRLVKSIIK